LSSNGDGAWSWVAGVYYFNEDVKIDSFNFDTLGGGAQNGFATQTQDTTAFAVFGSATFKASDKLALTAGVRYSDDEKDFVGRRLVSPFGAGALGPIVRTIGDEAVSWDLSAVYAMSEDANLYGRVARGFRAPAIQGRILFGDAVTVADSEFVTSYEAGVKATMFDRRLRADVGGFYYEIDDQQLTAIGGAGNFNQLVNAEKGEAYGFEGQFELAPNANWTFLAAVAYNNTEIKDACLTIATCGAPCTVRDPLAAPGVARINGNPFPNAPEWTGNLGARYEHPVANGGAIYASTDWAYKRGNKFLPV
jgi:iron complex outermembrane receptor protein